MSEPLIFEREGVKWVLTTAPASEAEPWGEGLTAEALGKLLRTLPNDVRGDVIREATGQREEFVRYLLASEDVESISNAAPNGGECDLPDEADVEDAFREAKEEVFARNYRGDAGDVDLLNGGVEAEVKIKRPISVERILGFPDYALRDPNRTLICRCPNQETADEIARVLNSTPEEAVKGMRAERDALTAECSELRDIAHGLRDFGRAVPGSEEDWEHEKERLDRLTPSDAVKRVVLLETVADEVWMASYAPFGAIATGNSIGGALENLAGAITDLEEEYQGHLDGYGEA